MSSNVKYNENTTNISIFVMLARLVVAVQIGHATNLSFLAT